MKSILFNSHDVVLILIISLCIALAIRFFTDQVISRPTKILLTTFFCLNALGALDNLLFWGDAIKHAAFNLDPWLPLLFSFAPFAIGPVFYWAFRSVTDIRFHVRIDSCLQLLPALLVPVYLYWACFRHPLEQQRHLILDLAIFADTSAHFLWFLTLKKSLPVFYGVLCVVTIYLASKKPARGLQINRQILLICGAFTGTWLWVLLTHLAGQWLPLAVSDVMGIVGNYLGLVFIAALLFSGSTRAWSAVPQPRGEKDDEADEIAALADTVEAFMQTQKPFLNPRLTLERFATLLQVSPRQISRAINGYHQQNFQEYLNRFRVEEAKRLLRDVEYQELTIMEIAQNAGFNSKATFNRFFKQQVGVTPTGYRSNPDSTQHKSELAASIST